ncbi:hypothetical protein [Pseudodesulfovibrio tunisiensis]|uniref:hypothetical protein n=1 Tax=Pseudodesulfovibrio tunisiensis TaxID=463192 RepID=UPI001FB4C290|nr:hypothetical protein [Pseudodesulfovibrio tunisiensis]
MPAPKTGNNRTARRWLAAILAVTGLVAVVTTIYMDLKGEADSALIPSYTRHGQTVVLIDRTTPLTPYQRSRLRKAAQEVRQTVASACLLSVYPIEPESDLRCVPFFQATVPGPWFRSNPESSMRERKAKRFFAQRYSKALEHAFASGINTKLPSPIIETINAVAFRTGLAHGKGQRRVVIFSDMIQDSPANSHNGCAEDFQSDPISQSLTRLDGVLVDIYYVPCHKHHAVQTRQHMEFWRAEFARAGALPRIIPVE